MSRSGTVTTDARLPIHESVDNVESVMNAVRAWAKAWESQDHALSFYYSGFSPNNGMTYHQWRDQRRSRLTNPLYIRIALTDVDVEIGIGPKPRYSLNLIGQTARPHSKRMLLIRDNVDGRFVRRGT